MAENPIRKEDIIDVDGLNTGLKELIKLLNTVLATMDAVKKQATETAAATAKLNPANKDDQKIIAAKTEEVKQLTESYSKLGKIRQQIEKTTSEEYREEVRLNQELQKRKKVIADEVKLEGAAEGSVKRLRLELSKLKEEYYAADKATREKLAPAVRELTTQVTKAEKAIGVHSRGVGSYKESIKSAGKELLAFLGVAGGGVMVLNKLKDAFLGTEAGAGFLKKTTEGTKAFFETLVSNYGGATNIGDRIADAVGAGKDAVKVAELMDRIRIGDRKDLVEIAKLETDLIKLRWQANDATLGEAKQLEFLNQAMVKEDDLLNYKIADKQEELDAVRQMLAIMPLNTKLLEIESQLQADIISIEGERNLRLQSRLTSLKEKQTAKELKAIQDKMEASKKASEKLQELSLDEISLAEQKSADLVEIKLQEIQKTQDAELANAEFQKELDEDVKNERINNFLDYSQQYLQIADALFQSFTNVLERRKQKELSMVGDNAEARAKIEKEFANKEKAMAISQAIIQTALNVIRAYYTFPVPNIPLAAITGALGAAQIGVIASQKFAEGGYTGGGTVTDETGEKVAGVVHEKEYVIPKEPTRKYRSLLEAIHQDNPMAIAEELRNRKFHQVWGGVQPKLSEAHRQDPYTKMMYELLKNSVTTYTDSNGDTVLRFADGTTRVIKK